MAPGNKPTVVRFNSVQSTNKFGEYGDMCWPNQCKMSGYLFY